MIHYIYKIVNSKNEKKYIGYTVDPNRRWKAHLYLAKSGKVNKLYDAMREHGIDNFSFEILFKSTDRINTLTVMEKYYIELYDSKSNGYNSTLGGAGALGWCPTSATRKLWSEQRTGHRHTEQYKSDMSTRLRDNPIIRSAATRKKQSDYCKANGIKPPSTPEIIEKIRVANTGKKKHSQAWKDILSNRLKITPLLSNPISLRKQKQNKKGKGTGARNGRARFCEIYKPSGELFCSGHLRTLCELHQLPFNTFIENSRSPVAMLRGKWVGWNVVNIPRQY